MKTNNSKRRATFPVHVVVMLIIALVLSPALAPEGAAALQREKVQKDRILEVEGKLVNFDKPHKPIHCLLWEEGRKVKCFSSIAKADAHASKMTQAARLVAAGRAFEVEGDVVAYACSVVARFWRAAQYGQDSLGACDDKADLTNVCNDGSGQCGIRFNDVISSMKITSPNNWCAWVYPATYYRTTSSLPHVRGMCGGYASVPDLRDRCVVSSGWICGENWNDVISSFEIG